MRVAAEEKPKIFEGAKDITLSLGVTVIAMLAVVGATGLCTINPESSQQAVQEVDAQTFLEMEARVGDTAVRSPQMPQGWKPNAARRASVAGENAPRVSWVTDSQGYVESTQTSVSVADAIKGYDSKYRPDTTTRQVDGVDVEVASSEDKDVRRLWVVDLGDERVIISGAADDGDFETAVRAFLRAQPLPNSSAA